MATPHRLDVIVFGGGASGLWLLAQLLDHGYDAVVLESAAMGSGQTLASQGIIHGGMKYALGPLVSKSARSIREMPMLWRRCLAGEARPDLSGTRRRAEFCHMWRTETLSSRMAMVGARAALRVTPSVIAADARPAPLRNVPGLVARVDEQVVEPNSLVLTLADRGGRRILKIDAESGLDLETTRPGEVTRVRLLNPESGHPIDLEAPTIIFTAGGGNARLRTSVGLAPHMQRRPLHMVAVRGDLPELNGHCVDGLATRATITSTHDYAGRTIWQVGGQIAEEGVNTESDALIRHARSELADVLPGHDLQGREWMTYRVDRAEAVTRGGRRPATETIRREGNTITGWPTKLALVPRLVTRIIDGLPRPAGTPAATADLIAEWPRPELAVVPWEEPIAWTTVD